MKACYSNEWEFFRTRILYIFLASLLIMITFATISYSRLSKYQELTKNREESLGQYLKAEGLPESKGFKRCVQLFLSNLSWTVKSTVSGIVPFLFLPILSTHVTGEMAGFVVALSKLKGYTTYKFIIKHTHAILEIPAVLYADSIGMYITIQISKKLIPKYRKQSGSLLALLRQVCTSYVLVIIPLLFVAAMIEVFISFRIS